MTVFNAFSVFLWDERFFTFATSDGTNEAGMTTYDRKKENFIASTSFASMTSQKPIGVTSDGTYVVWLSNGGPDATLTGVDAQTATIRWKQPRTGQVYVDGGAIGPDDTIYMLLQSATALTLQAVNPETGAELWSVIVASMPGPDISWGPYLLQDGSSIISHNNTVYNYK